MHDEPPCVLHFTVNKSENLRVFTVHSPRAVACEVGERNVAPVMEMRAEADCGDPIYRQIIATRRIASCNCASDESLGLGGARVGLHRRRGRMLLLSQGKLGKNPTLLPRSLQIICAL